MEAKKIIVSNKEITFLYIIFFVGIVGHLFGPLRNLMLLLTPATLLLTGLIVLFYSYKSSTNNFLLWAAFTYIITFLLEVIGVKTGMIFGEYNYGSTLGIKLFDVPLIIGFNWVFVILGSIAISRLLTNNIFLSSLISALIAFIFDLILEPIAIKLDYWSWSEGIIPIQNYLAWFVIAFIASVFFLKLNLKLRSDISIHYFFIQLVFFIILLIFS
ncbi:MAG TPA: carotenoid biosynthesis protein [Ignavibacteriaceae bacterium]|nr:carotenoid biosynthesis protein [Ignavibacteriaceae bacterium]